MCKSRTFIPMLTASFLSLAAVLCPLVLSCSGNGSAIDMDDETYIPGGGGVYGNGSGTNGAGSGSADSRNGGGSSSPSAIDILELANSGDVDSIVAVFKPATSTGGDGAPQPQTLTLAADAIGLPTGGTATLSITGRGVDYNVTVGADADGNVTFTVPAIATGTEVTVTLTVKAADGSLLYAGSKTQVLEGDASSLSISLSRQYWVMPASISVTATPTSLEYDPAALDSDGTTFSIIGLEDAPADVSYSWTDQDGNVVGTGSSLTRTVGQILGAGFVPVAAAEERTYTLTASYTDAAGTPTVLTAGASVTVVTDVTLRLTGSGIQSESGRQFIVLPKTASPVTVTADVLCYGGTPDYSWAITGGGLSPFPGSSGDSKDLSPFEGGKSVVTVTADLHDGRILTRELDVYILEARITGADVPSVAADPVVLENATGVSTLLTASLKETGSDLAALSGVEYSWDTDDIAVAVAGSPNSASTTITPAGTGATTVKATVTYKGVSVEATRTLVVAALSITSTGSFVYKWDPSIATQTMSLTVSLDGVPSAEAGSVTYMTGDYGSSDTTVATIAEGGTPSGTAITVTLHKGGLATINARASYRGKTFTAEQEITVLRLILGGTGLHHVTTGTPPAARDVVIVSPAVMDGTTEIAPAVTATLTMTLEDLAADSFEWESSTPTRCTVSPANTASTTVSPTTSTATGYVNAKATYNGEEISVLQQVTVTALSLRGDGTILLDHSDPTDSSLNRRQYEIRADGITTSDLNTASIAYTSVDTPLATVIKGGTGDASTLAATYCLVTGLDAGVATIKVTATETLTGTNIELTAIKKITVLDLVVKLGTTVLPDSGNIIAEGATPALTVELKGPPAGSDIEYAWSDGGSPWISVTSDSGDSTTLTTGTGVSAGSGATITVTATYNGAEYRKAMVWAVGFSGSTADFLKAAFAPTPSTVCKVEITGATSESDLQAIASALGNSSDPNYKDVYVKLDLSGVTGLTTTGDNTFDATGSNYKLAEYLTDVVLPTSSEFGILGIEAFKGCAALSGSITIPASCWLMGGRIFVGTNLTSLTDANPSRTWKRMRQGDEFVYPAAPWSGPLSASDIISVINADFTSTGDNIVYRDH
ncbi:MAG: leucine-rich repeat domain-containing protein [Treponema sp.]|nr:leucine-rich repeat domain-containing protein [Treponema sp.]